MFKCPYCRYESDSQVDVDDHVVYMTVMVEDRDHVQERVRHLRLV